MTKSNRFAVAVAQAIRADGGGTFDVVRQMPIEHRSGYLVSLAKFERKIDGRAVTARDVQRYVARIGEWLTCHPGNYLGVWRDDKTGASYLDVTQRFISRPAALEMARLRAQVAVYDLAADECIYL